MDVSFQLYSARNYTPWADVFARISALGYRQAEGFGGVYENPDETRAHLDAHGLAMPSGHFAIEMLENALDVAVSTARTLGVSKLYCPYLDAQDRPKDADGWRQIARRLSAIGAALGDQGLSFGWHNHDFEFEALGDGSVPMDILLAEAPDLEWEADIAWIARGGADPFDWIACYGQRITAAHVKDIAASGTCEDEDGWADVGHGTMDWPGLIRVLREAGCGLYIIEHDNPSDLDRFARRSITSLLSY